MDSGMAPGFWKVIGKHRAAHESVYKKGASETPYPLTHHFAYLDSTGPGTKDFAPKVDGARVLVFALVP